MELRIAMSQCWAYPSLAALQTVRFHCTLHFWTQQRIQTSFQRVPPGGVWSGRNGAAPGSPPNSLPRRIRHQSERKRSPNLTITSEWLDPFTGVNERKDWGFALRPD
jgi:hypothetical protein